MRRFANVKSTIPGPRSKAILELKDRFVARAMTIHAPVVIDRAEGAIVHDVDGNTFLDFFGGVGVMNVGHSDPEVLAAIQEQASRFTHTDFTILPYEPFVKLAERLARLVPGPSPKKVAFFNSGAEAVENAVKIARQHTRRPAVIALEGAFHGRTYMALSLTSKVKPYKANLGPFMPEVYRVPQPYCYRCPLGLRYPDCGAACAKALERAFVTQVAPDQTAAFIMEPVQGEGGFVVPPAEYVREVREITARHNVLFIADEIQTGFGRTGKLFAIEHFDVEPDLMTIAKSVAAGLPLSGVVGKAQVMDSAADSSIGGTYPGNPVACAAGLKVLDKMERENLPARAQRIGEIVRGRFTEMQKRFPAIGDVRGLGAMVAMELVRDRESKEPASQETDRILRRCLNRGLIAIKAGIYGNVIRFLAPLVITDEQLEEGLSILEEAMAEEFAG